MKQQNKRPFSRNDNKTQKIKISELKQKLKSLKQSLNQSESSLLNINQEKDKKRQKSLGGKIQNKLHQQQPVNLTLKDFQVFNNDLQCLSKQELIQLNRNILQSLQNKYMTFEFYQNKYQEIIQNLKKKILKQKQKISNEDNQQFELNILQDDLQFQRYEVLNQKIIELEKQNHELKSFTSQKDKKINSLKKQKTDQELKFTNERNCLQQKINSLQKKCTNYNNQMKQEQQMLQEEKENTLKKIKKHTNYLQNENRKLSKEIKILQDNKNQLENQIESLVNQNERHQTNIKDMKKNCKNIEEKMLEYQSQVDNYDFIKTERDNFKNYIQQLEKQNKQNLQKFLDIQQDYLKLNGEKIQWDNFEQDVKNFNREKDQITNQNRILYRENQDITKSNEQLKKQLENIQQQLNEKQIKELSSQENYYNQTIKVENLIKENQNLKNKLQRKKEHINNLKQNFDIIQKDLYRTKAELEVQTNKHKLEVFQKVIIIIINIQQQFSRSIIIKGKFTYSKQQNQIIR